MNILPNHLNISFENMRAPNPPALWPLFLPFHSVKGFQLSLGLFTAVLGFVATPVSKLFKKSAHFSMCCQGDGLHDVGLPKRSAQQGNRQQVCFLKKLLQHHAVSSCYGTRRRHVLPAWPPSWKAWQHLIWKYLVVVRHLWSCCMFYLIHPAIQNIRFFSSF